MHEEDARRGCTKRMHEEDARRGCTKRMHEEDVRTFGSVVVLA
jgi:hypothetical protein